MRLGSIAALAVAMGLVGFPFEARSETLVDQLCIVDFLEYTQGNAVSMIGGGALVGGVDIDSQIVDDFVVPEVDGEGYAVTSVTFDYLAILGADAPPSSLIEIFPDAAGVPSEVPVYSIITSATSTSWTPLQPSLNGRSHFAEGFALPLDPGVYWISMQPITITGAQWLGTGDILWAIQKTSGVSCVPPASAGGVTHFREGGIDPDVAHGGELGFGPLGGGGLCTGGCPDFAPLADPRIGLENGQTSFKVEGVPVPEPSATLLLCAGLVVLPIMRSSSMSSSSMRSSRRRTPS